VMHPSGGADRRQLATTGSPAHRGRRSAWVTRRYLRSCERGRWGCRNSRPPGHPPAGFLRPNDSGHQPRRDARRTGEKLVRSWVQLSMITIISVQVKPPRSAGSSGRAGRARRPGPLSIRHFCAPRCRAACVVQL
jgi:hypothetical protein